MSEETRRIIINIKYENIFIRDLISKETMNESWHELIRKYKCDKNIWWLFKKPDGDQTVYNIMNDINVSYNKIAIFTATL